jgi:hypothetical protein
MVAGKRGSPGVTVVDTPGFNSSLQQMEDMVLLLAEVLVSFFKKKLIMKR